MINFIIIYFQTDVNIESCEVVINSDVQQFSLNNLNQSSSSTIIINIPHASNILTKANTTIESNNFSYLPMVESLPDSSDSSMNNEHRSWIQWYNSRNTRLKKKKVTLPSTWEIKCSHANKSNLTVCRVAELTEEDIIAFKTNLCKIVGKIDQDKKMFITISHIFW